VTMQRGSVNERLRQRLEDADDLVG
jgi:hypothetical protein